MNHDELVDAGAQAMHDLFNRPGRATNREYAAAVVRAVEEKIRADERERQEDGWAGRAVTRDELVEAGAKALADTWPEGGDNGPSNRASSAAVVDAVVPPIFKAAEEHAMFLWGGRGWVKHRDCEVRIADLRAQVETLPIYHSGAKMQYVLRSSVLRMIDGGSDDV